MENTHLNANAPTPEAPSFVTDPALTLKAKGILMLIAVLPGKATSLDALAACSSDGRSATQAAVREALDAGYLRRTQMRRSNGTITSVGYTLTEGGGRAAAAPATPKAAPRGWAYAIADRSTPHVKIGCSVNPQSRLRGLQTGWPSPLEIIWQAPGGASLEAHLHTYFRRLRVRGEWFDFAGKDAAKLIAKAAESFVFPRGAQ